MDISDEENEIFEERNDENDQNEPVEANDNEEDGTEEKKEPVKAKRVMRNPRITLNVERLKGPKGLCAIEGCFEPVKFKGKGHEEQDLNVLLKTYEYWCHRLFPKFPFKETIEKIEKLGTKGPIQTHLKKIRAGIIDEDLPSNSNLIQQAESDNEDNYNDHNENLQATNQSIIADIPIELTEEQLETIRKNREKAEILRQERLRRTQEKADGIISEQHEKVSYKSGNTEIIRIENECDKKEEGNAINDDGFMVGSIVEMCGDGKEVVAEEKMEIVD